MLPGFRFLFAATVLTLSLVVFGLGAAALLRASHERFASLPTRPAPGPVFPGIPDAAPPTLALLRVAPVVEASAPEPTAPPADTLLSTDRMAALSTESRIAEIVTPPPAVDAKNEPTPEPVATVAEPAVAETPPPAPANPASVATIEEPARVGPPVAAAPEPARQLVALPEPDVTGTTPAPGRTEPPLVNATPIRRPPIPADRPAEADVVAALPDPALAIPATKTSKPEVRKRKPAVKRAVAKKRRIVTRPQRPAAASPASPFGSPGLGASPFGT